MKKLNIFAILIILMILVPEITGHLLFDRPHPANSSALAAIALTNKLNRNHIIDNFGCTLALENDSTSANITRAREWTANLAIIPVLERPGLLVENPLNARI